MGESSDNRWNMKGEPTLYLASSPKVAMAEFARHYPEDRHPGLSGDTIQRQVFAFELRIEVLMDLRERHACQTLAKELNRPKLSSSPHCFLDRNVARITAQYLRRVPTLQGILVPSMALLDDPTSFCMVLFLEKLPKDLSLFITDISRDIVVSIHESSRSL